MTVPFSAFPALFGAGASGGSGFLAGVGKAIPSIISGIGSLFGGGDESSTINYSALVKQAEKAGFNPLTALRAGGGAGFVQTHAPAFAGVATLANAAAQGIDAWMNFDPAAEKRALERDELEMEVLRAELGKIQADTHRSRSFNVPSAGVRNVGSPAGTKAGTNGPGASLGSRVVAGVRTAIDAVGSDDQIYDVPNPDAPMEAEQDIWRWIREGRIVEAAYAIAEKNNWSMAKAWEWANKMSAQNEKWVQGVIDKNVADPMTEWADQTLPGPPRRTSPRPGYGPATVPGWGWPTAPQGF